MKNCISPAKLLNEKDLWFHPQARKRECMGIEPIDASTLPENDLRQSDNSSAAKSGAVSVDGIIAMLATLPPEDRARLAALLSGQPEGEART